MVAISSVEGKVSAWDSVANLGNSAIGAGILSYPFAFQKAGLLGGVILCVGVAGLELLTLNVLAQKAGQHRASSYQGLVRRTLGDAASEVMAWTIFVYIFGGCVAYTIIAGDSLGAVLEHFVVTPLSLPPILIARPLMILLPSLLVMLPLSLQRSMGALAPASTLAVAVMAITTAIIVGKSVVSTIDPVPKELLFAAAAVPAAPPSSRPPLQLFTDLASMFVAVPIMVFAYQCHVQAVPIYHELNPASRLLPRMAPQQQPTSPAPLGAATVYRQKQRSMPYVLAVAVLECTLLYLATGIAGYVLFPTSARTNILDSFALSDSLMQLVRVLVGIAVTLHYPINQHVARSAAYDLVRQRCKLPEIEPEDIKYHHLATLTCIFMSATIATACLVTDLGVVFEIAGGLAGSMIIFVLPGALLCFDTPPDDTPEAGLQTALLPESEPALVEGESALLLAGEGSLMEGERRSGSKVPLWERNLQLRHVVGAMLIAVGSSVMVLTLASTVFSFGS